MQTNNCLKQSKLMNVTMKFYSNLIKTVMIDEEGHSIF